MTSGSLRLGQRQYMRNSSLVEISNLSSDLGRRLWVTPKFRSEVYVCDLAWLMAVKPPRGWLAAYFAFKKVCTLYVGRWPLIHTAPLFSVLHRQTSSSVWWFPGLGTFTPLPWALHLLSLWLMSESFPACESQGRAHTAAPVNTCGWRVSVSSVSGTDTAQWRRARNQSPLEAF